MSEKASDDEELRIFDQLMNGVCCALSRLAKSC